MRRAHRFSSSRTATEDSDASLAGSIFASCDLKAWTTNPMRPARFGGTQRRGLETMLRNRRAKIAAANRTGELLGQIMELEERAERRGSTVAKRHAALMRSN